jgi:hypothetical protein
MTSSEDIPKTKPTDKPYRLSDAGSLYCWIYTLLLAFFEQSHVQEDLRSWHANPFLGANSSAESLWVSAELF